MEKYELEVGKLDKGHMVAIFLYLVKPKELFGFRKLSSFCDDMKFSDMFYRSIQ